MNGYDGFPKRFFWFDQGGIGGQQEHEDGGETPTTSYGMHGFSFLLVLLAACSLSRCDLEPPAKLQLFTNGTIYIDADTKVDNLLVRNGLVTGVNVDPARHTCAERIDLNGAVAYPGFCDSHVHLMETGLFLYAGVNLIGCTNADEIAAALADHVQALPEGRMILGVGFSLRNYDAWSLADLAKIDAATGNHLAYLGDQLGHNVVINSAAIEYTGLTPATPVPLGGKMGIEDGKLTGMLRESAMILPSNKLFPLFDDEDIKAGTLNMLARWASFGYTGIVDLMGGPGARIMRPEIFKELEEEGRLPVRVHYMYTIFNLSDVDDAAAYMGHDTDLVRFAGCKIFVDGAFAGGQAWTSWTNEQQNNGLQEIYTDDIGGPELNLNRIVARVEEYGMNMHYHVQGDNAIDAVLDALDAVLAQKGEIKATHTLIHLAFVMPEQIQRIKAFNGKVVTTTQPGFWAVEKGTEYYYGERAEEAYPVKAMFDAGLSVGVSTDFSVSPLLYSPATAVIQVATTGAGNPAVHVPTSTRDIVEGFTLGSARTTEKLDTGKLDIGYKADIVVFDQDLYALEPEEFTARNPEVVATYLSGQRVSL